MAITTVIAIYFLIWWVTLFAVLPFGVRSQHEGEDYAQGTDPGAPIVARLGVKLIWTTAIATVLFAVLAVTYRYNLVPLGAFADWLRPPHS
jgi:predicted secreted protein